MNELNHPTNMQTIAKKLPCHLQARWRDCAVKLKEKGEKASFKDLTNFVVSEAESANDTVFGVQALSNSQERCPTTRNKLSKEPIGKRKRC